MGAIEKNFAIKGNGGEQFDGANTVIASAAKQSTSPPGDGWIASLRSQ
jgi:hypothetical protein